MQHSNFERSRSSSHAPRAHRPGRRAKLWAVRPRLRVASSLLLLLLSLLLILLSPVAGTARRALWGLAWSRRSTHTRRTALPFPSAWPRGGGMATAAPFPPESEAPVLPDVDEDDDQGDGVVSLAQSLIDIQSLSGNEQRVAAALSSWLTKRGWTVTLQRVDKASPTGEDRFNIFAHRPELGPDPQPRLLFNTHIDTVPPFIPATLDRAAGVLRGRGACDTKGILAAQLLAAQRLVKEGRTDVGLLYVVSEETDHSGMKAANQLHLRPDFLVVGEPTESRMIRSQKGILKLKFTAHGVSCHSGYPHLGKSATATLIDVLHELQHTKWPTDPELGDTTLNVGTMNGGHAANALASHAEAYLMFRVISPPADILARVRDMVKGRVDVEVVTSNSPVELGTTDGYELDIVAFNTDIPYFDLPPQAKAFLIGPGSILDAHADHEKIGLEELRAAVGLYAGLARKLLSTPK